MPQMGRCEPHIGPYEPDWEHFGMIGRRFLGSCSVLCGDFVETESRRPLWDIKASQVGLVNPINR